MADSSTPATSDQKAFLQQLGVSFPADITRERATELINAGVKNRDAKKATAERDRKAKVKANRKQAKKGGGFKSLLRFLLLFAVLGVLAAIFIPVKPTGDGSDLDETHIRSARGKLLALQNRPQSAQKFTEEEINAYLADVVQNRNQAQAAGTRLRPELINVDTADNALGITVHSKFTVLPISYHLAVQPSSDGATLDPQPTAAKLGQLPMPGPLQQMIFHKYEAMFQGLPAEAKIWNQLELLKAEDGSVTVRRAL